MTSFLGDVTKKMYIRRKTTKLSNQYIKKIYNFFRQTKFLQKEVNDVRCLNKVKFIAISKKDDITTAI